MNVAIFIQYKIYIIYNFHRFKFVIHHQHHMNPIDTFHDQKQMEITKNQDGVKIHYQNGNNVIYARLDNDSFGNLFSEASPMNSFPVAERLIQDFVHNRVLESGFKNSIDYRNRDFNQSMEPIKKQLPYIVGQLPRSNTRSPFHRRSIVEKMSSMRRTRNRNTKNKGHASIKKTLLDMATTRNQNSRAKNEKKKQNSTKKNTTEKKRRKLRGNPKTPSKRSNKKALKKPPTKKPTKKSNKK